MCLGSDRIRQAKMQTLKSEFEVLSMKETETIGEFCMMLNDLVTNIRALGEIVEKCYVVKKLLRAVPSRFLQISSVMEQFGKLNEMSIEEAVGSLKAHEEKTHGQIEKLGNQLLLTEDEWAKRETNGGQLLLTKKEWLKRTKKVEERTLLLNEKDVRPKLSKDSEMQTESNLLYLDNGASNHMTGLRSKFKELDESITGQVKFGDGSLAIKLMSKNNMAYGIPKLLNPKEMCTGCLMSKQARGLFLSKENFS
ncbi:uncharacterized protein LOC141702070 [Apium graveolens]|uniref:uncharacterized protein LOC141702070 n=1 Tax=Apium graveolens TaxID=4045 RepID=UPI003D790B4C